MRNTTASREIDEKTESPFYQTRIDYKHEILDQTSISLVDSLLSEGPIPWISLGMSIYP